jgi:hypothetical protein
VGCPEFAFAEISGSSMYRHDPNIVLPCLGW